MKPQAPTPPDAKTQARRRLLRGSFSVPAVLAVHNGSALAARSNQFRCVLNQTPASGGAFPGLADTTQNWVRVPRYRSGNNSNQYRYWVSVGDLTNVAVQSGLGYGGPAGTSVSVSISSATVLANWLPWHTGNPTAPQNNASLTQDGSVAVVFESSTSGNPPVVTVKVVGFVKQGQQSVGFQGASTQSCWTSIR